MFSKAIAAKQSDWPAQTVISGFPFYDQDGESGLSAELTSFLDSGPPPIEGGCDALKLPTAAPCVVDDSVGVFVSSSLGTDKGDGTRARPLRSLQAGIDLAKATKRRVYACAETYAEAITLSEGVSVFGCFDCGGGWKIGEKRAVVRAPASPAAKAQDIAKPTRIEALEILAPDVMKGSSIGMVAIGSAGL
jgi:hypothetical protein